MRIDRVRRVGIAATATAVSAVVALAGLPATGWGVASAPAPVVVGDPTALNGADGTLIAELEDMVFAVTAVGMNAWDDLEVTTGPEGVRIDTQDLVVGDSAQPIAAGLRTVFAPADSPAHTLTDLSSWGSELVDNAIMWTAGGATGATAPGRGPRPARTRLGSPIARGSFQQVGRWNFDRVNDTADTTPSTSGSDPGVLDHTTTVIDDMPVDSRAAAVAPSGSGSLYFPGWKDSAPPYDDVVNATASSVRVADKAYFNPLTTHRFRIEVFVRPDNSDGFDSPVPAGESPNIVQKGLRTRTSGQWKVSMTKDMYPICTFRGDTDPGSGVTIQPREKRIPASQSAMAPGRPYQIRCELLNGSVTVTLSSVEPDGRIVFMSSATKPAPVSDAYFDVVNADPIWVGKKPDDTTAGDTFAGAIDNLTIFQILS